MDNRKTFLLLLLCSAFSVVAFMLFSSRLNLSTRSRIDVIHTLSTLSPSDVIHTRLVDVEDAASTLSTSSFSSAKNPQQKRKTPKHHEEDATKAGTEVFGDKTSSKLTRTGPEVTTATIAGGSGVKNKTKAGMKKVPSAVASSRLATATTATKLGSAKVKAKKTGIPEKSAVGDLTNTNFSAINSYNNSDKWVVFVCDGRRSCGGWGDRQRALTGVYILAVVTGRRFGLVLTRPCDVTHHYVPNVVPWHVPLKTLKEVGRGSNISMDDVNSRLKMTARLRFMDFNVQFPQRVVYIRTNGEYWLGLRNSQLYKPVLPDWARGSRAQFFATAWERLMKPSPTLQASLDEFLGKIRFKNRTQPLVCAHVRVGRSATFKRDTEVRCNITTLPVLWNFLQRWVNNGSQVFLATDSYEVRNLTRHRFGDKMVDTGQNIVHVDQRNGPASEMCTGFGSALLDQLILARCDVLVTSHSIFSQRASYMRGRSDNLFSFIKGKISKIFI